MSISDISATPVPGLRIVPIRHHSPACAAALSALIAAERPERVLIEMPSDFEAHLPVLRDPATRPPVAITALLRRGEAEELAGSYPFSRHSPEWIAIREAGDAEITFIDLPAGARLREADPAAPAQPLAEDDGLAEGAYIAALCERTGCRDGFELWDRLFESRMHAADPEALLSDVLAYCAALRETAPAGRIEGDDTLPREASMIAHMARAMRAGGTCFVVVGGFHAPPLIEAAQRIAEGWTPPEPEPAAPARSWLARYGMRELDALNAYAAGLPSPGWYDAAWEAGFADVMTDALLSFRRTLPDPPSLPATIEAMRMAEGLAAMRGLPGPMRSEIEDAARTAFVKGDAGFETITRDLRVHLAGTAIGDVPPSAGSPPLLESVRAHAAAFRFDVEDGASRERRLDMRRDARHARISAFLHALSLIGIDFARLESGPDFASGRRTELIIEVWTAAWSHRVEAQLIEKAHLGSTLRSAALRTLALRFEEMRRGPDARDTEAAIELLGRGVVAGLGASLAPFAARIDAMIAAEARFEAAAGILRRLSALARGTRAMAGEEAFDAGALSAAAHRRMLLLIPDLGATPGERTGAVIGAMRDAKAAAAEMDDDGFARAIAALARREDARNPAVTGSVLAIAAGSDAAFGDILVRAVRGALGGVALDGEARVAVLRGAITADPGVLWSVDGLPEAMDGALLSMDEEAFLAVLPDLRAAFTALNPRETDRVAEAVAARHGGALPTTSSATLEEAARGGAIDAAIRAALEADGLAGWPL